MKIVDQVPNVDAETNAIIEHAMTGMPLDPELVRRVREQGEALRREILEKHGLVDIAVPAIRELRGELPCP
jgi:hypothetical protein